MGEEKLNHHLYLREEKPNIHLYLGEEKLNHHLYLGDLGEEKPSPLSGGSGRRETAGAG